MWTLLVITSVSVIGLQSVEGAALQEDITPSLGAKTVVDILTGDDNSCTGRCGDPFDSNMPCQCNDPCKTHNDCCADYGDVCSAGTCAGRCGAGFDASQVCQCNEACLTHNDCCPDYNDLCGGSGGVTVADMQILTEELLTLDSDNVGSLIKLDEGGITSQGNPTDNAPNNLFTSVDPSVDSLPIYVKLAALYDNYEVSQSVAEDHTPEEEAEEREFLQLVMESEIMQVTYAFLIEKGVFVGTYQDFSSKIYSMWFGLYERMNKLSTSGFEHVFLGELKGNEVGGFHNWYHWYKLEQTGHINYLGHWSDGQFGAAVGSPESLGGGLEGTYLWDGAQKPYGSMFIGTSPTLELAIYSASILAFPDKEITIKLAGSDVQIQTWQSFYNGELRVGSSYPSFRG